jgi:hypothetical protein
VPSRDLQVIRVKEGRFNGIESIEKSPFPEQGVATPWSGKGENCAWIVQFLSLITSPKNW